MGFDLPPDHAIPAPVDRENLPQHVRDMVDASVEKFRATLGAFAAIGNYVDDYRREVERLAFCSYRAGYWAPYCGVSIRAKADPGEKC
jgi:hypothetical protein